MTQPVRSEMSLHPEMALKIKLCYYALPLLTTTKKMSAYGYAEVLVYSIILTYQ